LEYLKKVKALYDSLELPGIFRLDAHLPQKELYKQIEAIFLAAYVAKTI
jgi:hypothetical protein